MRYPTAATGLTRQRKRSETSRWKLLAATLQAFLTIGFLTAHTNISLAQSANEMSSPESSASPLVLTTDFVGKDTRLFQATYSDQEWSGRLSCYKVDVNTGAPVLTKEWEASELIPEGERRQIITVNSDGQATAFRWNDLDAVRKRELGPGVLNGEAVVSHIRGEQKAAATKEIISRAHGSRLGDIIHSTPIFVDAPPPLHSSAAPSQAAGYSSFYRMYRNRPAMVYVGANDGMLHGFDAATGVEIFSFIPSAVFANLHHLAEEHYIHRFFVDGSPNASNAFIKGAWRTILVGGLSLGGRGIYALDITDPTVLRVAEKDPTKTVLWEFTAQDDPNLGYTFSQPAIVPLHNGKWGVVFGNGYVDSNTSDGAHSGASDAALYILNLEDGSLLRKISTLGDGSGIRQRNGVSGLSEPALVDTDGDGIADYAYAGDRLGNLWKFDLTTTDSRNWKVAFEDRSGPLPLFQARDGMQGKPQPIVTRPNVIRGPNGNDLVVLFGTGEDSFDSDGLSRQKTSRDHFPQSFYGIIDHGSNTLANRIEGRANLLRQSILSEVTLKTGESQMLPSRTRITSANELHEQDGWYLDLISPQQGYDGEKQVSDSVVRDGRVIFVTTAWGANKSEQSWVMELNALTGSRLNQTPFDLNGDGIVDSTDYRSLDSTSSNNAKAKVSVSGIQFTGLGVLQTPQIIDASIRGRVVQLGFQSPSNGTIKVTRENPRRGSLGRQSWREMK